MWLGLSGPEGGLFKGVVAHINGYTKVPVASIREMLNARSGVVEAYNTSKCTHVICESLPYAKIRELRKVRYTTKGLRGTLGTGAESIKVAEKYLFYLVPKCDN